MFCFASSPGTVHHRIRGDGLHSGQLERWLIGGDRRFRQVRKRARILDTLKLTSVATAHPFRQYGELW